MKTIHLGFEIGTGKPIAVPLRNLAITGQTQESGKTTTLEALAVRSGAKVLTFVTKRGEGSFKDGQRVQPYFRDRADWQFVMGLIETMMQEKFRQLRQVVIPLCRTTRTLEEVKTAVDKKGTGIHVEISAYLDLILPQIKKAKLATALELRRGLNVMDIVEFSTPMQMLFVQSALDWVNDRERDTVVVIPEAWEFIPEGKGSPVKPSAIALVRKGSAIGNHIWIDSQDMAGVDKVIIRGCPVILVGAQREINEVKRNLANIPPPAVKLKPHDVQMLRIGQFFACFGSTLAKTYVQPVWMNDATAESIAMGSIPVADAMVPPWKGGAFAVKDGEKWPPLSEAETPREEEVDQATADRITAENTALTARVQELETETGELRQRIADAVRTGIDALNAAMAAFSQFGFSKKSDAAPTPQPIKAKPSAPAKELPAPAPEVPNDGTISGGALSLLRVLVRSYPQPLSAELWGAFANRAPVGGSWNSNLKQLRDKGFMIFEGGAYRALPAGIAASGEGPAEPKTVFELWALWSDRLRDTIGPGPLSLLSTLAVIYPRTVSVEQWGLLAGKASVGGAWNANTKTLRDWNCVTVENGRYAAAEPALTLVDVKPNKSFDLAGNIRNARAAKLDSARRLYDAFTDGARTREEIAKALSLKMVGGHWNSSIKELLDSGLVIEKDGRLEAVKEDLG